MKNLIIAFVSIFALAISTNLTAQPINKNNIKNVETTSSSNDGEIAILQNFKATKAQKKVIRKMKRYVSPRILGDRKHTTALEGKEVTVQISLDENGAIKNMQIVKGYEPIIDQRVLDFIKEYDSKKPLANSSMEQPSIIQVKIPLVKKKQYMH